MSSAQITDHDERIKSLLLNQFSDSDNLKGLLTAISPQVQEIEDTLLQLLEDRMLENAEGEQLDRFGEIVGEERLGKTDDEYRESIDLRIFLNVSKGRPYDVIEAVRRITNATRVIYQEDWPAGVSVFSDGTFLQANLDQIIEDILPAGVSFAIVYLLGYRLTESGDSRITESGDSRLVLVDPTP